jgi:hypothetical protein
VWIDAGRMNSASAPAFVPGCRGEACLARAQGVTV